MQNFCFWEILPIFFFILTINGELCLIKITIVMEFDFKKYHIRSINAADATERASINQELKDLYDQLCAEDKNKFNEQLKIFLTKEVSRIKSDYESVNGLDQSN